MTTVARSLMEVAARLLERDEREVVLGDLAEAGASAWQGLLEILGLVIRREALVWSDCRPWVAAFGVSLPSSMLLMGVSLSVSCTFERLAGLEVFAPCAPTGQEDFPLLLCHIALLTIWAWTGGFVVGFVSRRTLWVSVIAGLAPCAFCLTRFHYVELSRFCLLLFVLPALLGLLQGLRLVRVKPGAAAALAMVATALMIWAWTGGALWVFNWALILPAWYIVLLARRPRPA
jgi:hypothetical protein